MKRLRQQHDKEKLPWDKMAVFYRVNSLSRVLEDALMKAAVPYQIARGTEFYGRKEIKDVLAYLRVINNPNDNVSFERIINVPPRGLGGTSVSRLEAFAGERGISLLEACGSGRTKQGGLTPRAVNACRNRAQLFAEWARGVGAGAAIAAENAGESSAGLGMVAIRCSIHHWRMRWRTRRIYRRS